jgi:uncharacterized membrane protein YuzA (DUF378 family)
MRNLSSIEIIVFILTIVGGINWGLVGAFQFDLVAFLLGEMSSFSRAVYSVVGIASVWSFIVLTSASKEDN